MKKYLVEFIGTFFLVLTFIMAGNNPGIGSMAPLAVGAMLMVMIYAGSAISGAHYNPVVTLAMLLRGKLLGGEVIYYVLAQLAGSMVAASFGAYLHSCGGGSIAERPNEQPICAVLAEFLGTYALVYVVLHVIAHRTNAENAYAGAIIGATMMAALYGLGSLSGGAFNPAIAFGEAVAGMLAWTSMFVSLIGSLLGAAAATTTYHVLYGRED